MIIDEIHKDTILTTIEQVYNELLDILNKTNALTAINIVEKRKIEDIRHLLIEANTTLASLTELLEKHYML